VLPICVVEEVQLIVIVLRSVRELSPVLGIICLVGVLPPISRRPGGTCAGHPRRTWPRRGHRRADRQPRRRPKRFLGVPVPRGLSLDGEPQTDPEREPTASVAMCGPSRRRTLALRSRAFVPDVESSYAAPRSGRCWWPARVGRPRARGQPRQRGDGRALSGSRRSEPIDNGPAVHGAAQRGAGAFAGPCSGSARYAGDRRRRWSHRVPHRGPQRESTTPTAATLPKA